MSVSVPMLELAGGHRMPIVGLGTSGQSEEVEKSLDVALELGYRHIDTAYLYGTEEVIGDVLEKWISSGKIKREELFIVTKLPFSGNKPERVEECLKMSLKRLKLDYVDLYLIHFPIYMEPIGAERRLAERIAYPTDHVSLWKKMEEQVDAGRAKSIGLSNFNIRQISNILKIARIKPAVLQVEIHIYLQNNDMVNYAQTNGIAVTAYSPLGAAGKRSVYSPKSGLPLSLIQDSTVARIATKHKKSPGQILLKFLIQRNIAVIPKSSSPIRLKENLSLFDFTLDQDDMETLRGLDVGERARLCFIALGPKSVTEHPEWPFVQKGPYYAASEH